MKKKTKFMIFTCNHDDPSWCGKECTEIVSQEKWWDLMDRIYDIHKDDFWTSTTYAPKWLDISLNGRMVEINEKGKVREKKKSKRV